MIRKLLTFTAAILLALAVSQQTGQADPGPLITAKGTITGNFPDHTAAGALNMGDIEYSVMAWTTVAVDPGRRVYLTIKVKNVDRPGQPDKPKDFYVCAMVNVKRPATAHTKYSATKAAGAWLITEVGLQAGTFKRSFHYGCERFQLAVGAMAVFPVLPPAPTALAHGSAFSGILRAAGEAALKDADLNLIYFDILNGQGIALAGMSAPLPGLNKHLIPVGPIGVRALRGAWGDRLTCFNSRSLPDSGNFAGNTVQHEMFLFSANTMAVERSLDASLEAEFLEGPTPVAWSITIDGLEHVAAPGSRTLTIPSFTIPADIEFGGLVEATFPKGLAEGTFARFRARVTTEVIEELADFTEVFDNDFTFPIDNSPPEIVSKSMPIDPVSRMLTATVLATDAFTAPSAAVLRWSVDGGATFEADQMNLVDFDGEFVTFETTVGPVPVAADLETTVEVFDGCGNSFSQGVGGIAELPEAARAPLEAPASSGADAGLLAGIIGGAVAAGSVALVGAAWYVRGRRLR